MKKFIYALLISSLVCQSANASSFEEIQSQLKATPVQVVSELVDSNTMEVPYYYETKLGIIRVLKAKQKLFTYKLEDGTLVTIPTKFKFIKDTRPFSKKHPIIAALWKIHSLTSGLF